MRDRIRLAIALLALAGSAEPTLSTERAPNPPTWGTMLPATEWPWTAIGRVNIPTITQSIFCTGVLVHPRIVLTAAHCVYVGFEVGPKQTTYRRLDPQRLFFRAGVRHETDQGHSAVDSIQISPDYSPTDTRDTSSRNDWALLVLRDPVPVKPLKITPESADVVKHLSDDGLILQAGYGWDRPMEMSVFRPCPVDPSSNPPAYVIACLTTFGYSGAPLLVFQEGAEPSILGIGSPSPWIVGMGNPGRRGPPPSSRSAFACPAGSFAAAVEKLVLELGR